MSIVVGGIHGVDIPQRDLHPRMHLSKQPQCLGFYVLRVPEQQQIGFNILATGEQTRVGKSLSESFRSEDIGTRSIIDREGIDIMASLAKPGMELELAVKELRSVPGQAVMGGMYNAHAITCPIGDE